MHKTAAVIVLGPIGLLELVIRIVGVILIICTILGGMFLIDTQIEDLLTPVTWKLLEGVIKT